MKKILMCAAGAIVLVGCGRSEAEQPERALAGAFAGKNAAYAQETGYQERLRLLEEGQRNGVFLRALRDAGLGCQEVRGSEYLGTADGHARWSAICRDRSQWLITVGGSDVAKIMSLADAQRTQQKRGTGQTGS